ncbi:hypothetical protein MASR1M107_06070 [Ignavibacteriales bacterium]
MESEYKTPMDISPEKRAILIKEIDLIQDIIKRLASNSFIIKGWTITIVIATLLLKGEKIQILLAVLPTIVFWFLDTYFLRQERIYRLLFDWIVKFRSTSNEFIFNLTPHGRLKKLAHELQKPVQSFGFIRVMFSMTIWPLYISILALIITYYFLYESLKAGGV